MGGGVGTAPGDGGSNPSRGRRGRVGGKGSAQPSDKVLKVILIRYRALMCCCVKVVCGREYH